MDAPILQVITQRHAMDCSVACLAMLLGVCYENALVAIAPDNPDVCVKGAWDKQITRAARRLGYRLRVKRRVDLENDTGILNVFSKRWKHAHLVVLKNGLIFDTDACVYDADVFMSAHKAKAGSLLVAEAV
jgi:ABC-type bacteriocin/lantibiotic exporter with double-glycine peptidase domain